jgi:aminoglycoside 2'-N-acetyltransferase I
MPEEIVRLDRIPDFSDADREELRALSLAVYPPADAVDWPGRRLQWAAAEWGVRVYGCDGALVSYVGITLREARHDGGPVRVGGIGGVKTHPAARRRGFAARGMRRAAEFFRDERIDFGLLVCAPHLLGHYGRLGWRPFEGTLLVRQHGETVPFTFNEVMTCAVRSPAPAAGVIDLLGPPW